jgi:hypothetical protein
VTSSSNVSTVALDDGYEDIPLNEAEWEEGRAAKRPRKEGRPSKQAKSANGDMPSVRDLASKSKSRGDESDAGDSESRHIMRTPKLDSAKFNRHAGVTGSPGISTSNRKKRMLGSPIRTVERGASGSIRTSGGEKVIIVSGDEDVRSVWVSLCMYTALIWVYVTPLGRSSCVFAFSTFTFTAALVKERKECTSRASFSALFPGQSDAVIH